ncbi:hypothetical protein PQR39_10195 [Paraburkholderia sediminicola]|uniref:hypothetical protein n=1 Tax=Paraburkholderia sediminicola TaxID=458836 RepID=UPI0038B780D0
MDTTTKSPDIDKLANIASCNCEPLYLSPIDRLGDHSASKSNATMTYIRYRDELFGVTCAHVFDFQFGDHERSACTLGVFGAGTSYQFTHPTFPDFHSHLRSLRQAHHQEAAEDIAVVRLSSLFEEKHMRAKNKVAIDLDAWEEPDWSAIQTCVSVGFPTEHKIQSRRTVTAQPLFSVAELTRKLDPIEKTFALCSTIENRGDYFLSGMSGGPAYCTHSNDTLTLLGIVFEGTPGSSGEWSKRSDESIFSKDDVYFRITTLRPEIFKNWLGLLEF